MEALVIPGYAYVELSCAIPEVYTDQWFDIVFCCQPDEVETRRSIIDIGEDHTFCTSSLCDPQELHF